MNVPLERSQIERFRTVVGRCLGLEFDEDRLDSLADVLRQRLQTSSHPRVESYLDRLAMGDLDELRALAERLTVSETYFFRYWDQFRAFTELVLPSRANASKERRELRIVSAGCASGEEAYSLAILLRDELPDFGSWDLTLRGIDVNPLVVEKARRGRYSPWSLRSTPADLRARYFRPEGRDLVLREDVRSMVTFDVRNLVDDDPVWREGSLDVVFCRNVTMYFTPEVTRAVIGRIHRALLPGGFLFMGHAESLRGISQSFHLCHTHDTFYYQRREVPGLDAVVPTARPTRAEPAEDASWVDVIHDASQRIATLSRGPRASSTGAPAVSRPRGDSSVDPDAQLLRAVLLTNGGRLDEAEGVCAQILSVDELNAGAHYLMALCREHAGDLRGAVDHDQSSTYLDGEFVMPRLHLGLLARRAGDVEQARSELGRAITLLGREDASRIALFGGGFTREALVELCRSELRTCGGAPW